jgi:putative mRNA 3-end processing factor
MLDTTGHWIEPRPQGIYVRPADIWIDPTIPVSRAIITHGHADHARAGHEQVWATPQTHGIMSLRYGLDIATQSSRAIDYGDGFEKDGVRFSLHPAGHVLGSAQVLIEHAGERVVVTGDYKRRADPTCALFEPVKCDIFITEATFGLPVFNHPPIEREIARLVDAVTSAPDRCVLVGAYALGKAQRVIAELRRAGWDSTIYLHGAMVKMCEFYERSGVALGVLIPVSEATQEELRGSIIIAPPSALHDRWSRRLPDPITALASGWMMIKQRARQKLIELPLVISDHADWNELTQTIIDVDPIETWVTHGSEDGLLRWCELNQRRARALRLVDRDGEDGP